MKQNTSQLSPRPSAEKQLSRAVMACMLWEDQYYENGLTTAEYITQLVAQVSPEYAAACAYHARTQMHLRHVPLLIVREMARLPKHKALVAKLLPDIIQRADEITEFLAIYWKDKRQPLSAQVKKGLAKAFNKFSEYDFAKYNQKNKVRLRDALFLCHSRPDDSLHGSYTKLDRKANNLVVLSAKEKLFKAIVNDELKTPDTWEVAISAIPKNDTPAVRAEWQRLLNERKLGALAYLRNLRNMISTGVPMNELEHYATNLDVTHVLPFRFIAAARYAPQMEPILETLMLSNTTSHRFTGTTALLVDVSGSMMSAISAKSDLSRIDAACALAILLRETSNDIAIGTFSQHMEMVPPRRGFALRDSIINAQPAGSTYLGSALEKLQRNIRFDRIIVITDEQSHDEIGSSQCNKAYIINIAAYKNGVVFKQASDNNWITINGWSESVIDFIKEIENTETTYG